MGECLEFANLPLNLVRERAERVGNGKGESKENAAPSIRRVITRRPTAVLCSSGSVKRIRKKEEQGGERGRVGP